LVVGGCGAIAFIVFRWWLPVELAVLMSTAVTLVVTGGFHEDGLADSCDAFGGGYRREDILRIMKDSRIGTFGALGVFVVLVIKWAALVQLPNTFMIVMAMLLAHSLSRLNALHIMTLLPYIEGDRLAKSDAVSKGNNAPNLIFAHLSVVPLVLVLAGIFDFFIIALIYCGLAVVLVAGLFYFKHRIQGYTGDCLGAMQQISEIVIYLVLVALLSSTAV